MNKKKRRSWGLIIITGCFVLNLGMILIRQEKMMRDQQKELENLRLSIESENDLNKRLVQQKEEVDTDEYKEMIARRELGMIKDGERVFIDIN